MKTRSFVSIGQAAALLQAMPSRIRMAAAKVGVTPQLRLNGVDHFDERDIEQIAGFLRVDCPEGPGSPAAGRVPDDARATD